MKDGHSDSDDDDEDPNNAWEYCFFHEGMVDKLNSMDKGQKATLWRATHEPNWKKLAKKQNVWCNVRGVGNSSSSYALGISSGTPDDVPAPSMVMKQCFVSFWFSCCKAVGA